MTIVNIRHDFVSRETIENQNKEKMNSFIKNLNVFYDDYEKNYIQYDYGNRLKSDGTPYITLEQKRHDINESIMWFYNSLERFNNVRIIERLDGDKSLFYLVYDDVPDETVTGGTGAFGTLEAAKKWFMGGGR